MSFICIEYGIPVGGGTGGGVGSGFVLILATYSETPEIRSIPERLSFQLYIPGAAAAAVVVAGVSTGAAPPAVVVSVLAASVVAAGFVSAGLSVLSVFFLPKMPFSLVLRLSRASRAKNWCQWSCYRRSRS